MNAFVVGLPSAVTPISIPVPTQHVCHALQWDAIPALWDTVDPPTMRGHLVCIAKSMSFASFLPYSMLSHASEPCKMRHVGGSDRAFDGNHKIVVDCGGSRVSISGNVCLNMKGLIRKNKMVVFCILAYLTFDCLTWKYTFTCLTSRKWETCRNFFFKLSSASFTMLLLPNNRHFQICEHQ